MDKKDQLVLEMIEHDAGNPWMVQHLLKVHQFSRLIGRMEGLDNRQMEILEVASIVHDIGIKIATEKYGDSSGPLQEKEGPIYVEKLLQKLDYDKELIERVSYLVAHHHTYTDIDGQDYQILVEADFLVNLYEKNKAMDSIKNAYDNIFMTESGKTICRKIFGF